MKDGKDTFCVKVSGLQLVCIVCGKMIIVEGENRAFLWLPCPFLYWSIVVEEARWVSGVKNRSWLFFSWVASSLSSCLRFLLKMLCLSRKACDSVSSAVLDQRTARLFICLACFLLPPSPLLSLTILGSSIPQCQHEYEHVFF